MRCVADTEWSRSAPPGWFADPWGQAPLRWWDGYHWTGSVAPLAARSERQRRPWRWKPRVTVISVVIALAWCVLVAIALQSTLSSLRTDDFDGLNNMLQIPFALPWFLIPIGGLWSHETDAWVAA